MRDDPLIRTGRVVRDVKTQMAGRKVPNNLLLAPDHYDQKGVLLIRYLWQKGTESIYDMRAMKTDASSCLQRSP